MGKRDVTIKKRIAEDKKKILEGLRKTPIVQLAAKNAGVGRTTYYRWLKEDKKFAQAAEEATRAGYLFVNDIAESQILSLIKDKKMEAIRLWLKAHHPVYADKLQIVGNIQYKYELTKKQKATIRKALLLANITKKSYVEQKKYKKLGKDVLKNDQRSSGADSNGV